MEAAPTTTMFYRTRTVSVPEFEVNRGLDRFT